MLQCLPMANNNIGFKQTIEWYEAHAEEYAQKVADKRDSFLLDRFTKKLPAKAKILDAGCGAGRDCMALAEKGLIPTGLDLAGNLIKLAKKHQPKLNFIKGNFLDLPFPDNSFDGVWANASLVHLETIKEVKQALKEFRRVMKHNGIAHIFVKQQPGEKKTEVVAHGHSDDVALFFRWFTKAELKKLLQESGITILSIEDNYSRKGGRKNIKWIAALVQK